MAFFVVNADFISTLPLLKLQTQNPDGLLALLGQLLQDELRQDHLSSAVSLAATARGHHRPAPEPLEGAESSPRDLAMA